MSLNLGKTFDRNYNIRIPFLDGFYNIGTFFNKKSSFLLFSVDPVFTEGVSSYGIKVNMFKNLESSKFCETFLNLHNYKKSTLDIVNQYQEIKTDYYFDVNMMLNETLKLTKVVLNDDKSVYDTLTLYGFTLSSYNNEFVFIIAERQNIIKRLGKKIVRTTGVQISTSNALTLLEEFYQESKRYKSTDHNVIVPSDEKEIITL